jgi:hypothetical protein
MREVPSLFNSIDATRDRFVPAGGEQEGDGHTEEQAGGGRGRWLIVAMVDLERSATTGLPMALQRPANSRSQRPLLGVDRK